MRLFRNILVVNILVTPSFLNGIENLHLEAKAELSFPELPRCGIGVSSNFSSVNEFFIFYVKIGFLTPNTAGGSSDGVFTMHF